MVMVQKVMLREIHVVQIHVVHSQVKEIAPRACAPEDLGCGKTRLGRATCRDMITSRSVPESPFWWVRIAILSVQSQFFTS